MNGVIQPWTFFELTYPPLQLYYDNKITKNPPVPLFG